MNRRLLPAEKGRKEYRPLQITKNELLIAAKRHHGVMKNIAEEFNVSRRSLYYHLERIGNYP
jgi:AcrR family transcriptional regulator